MRSPEVQIGAMRLHWPGFRLLGRSGGRLRWRGIIQPISAQYEIEVVYRIPKHRRGQLLRPGIPPTVTVVNPLLRRREANPSELIPHIYKNLDAPDYPFLCLYHPKQKEWNNSCLIALAIIPWASEWLACYEIWHATEEWLGGGAHPEESNYNDKSAA